MASSSEQREAIGSVPGLCLAAPPDGYRDSCIERGETAEAVYLEPGLWAAIDAWAEAHALHRKAAVKYLLRGKLFGCYDPVEGV